MHRCRPPGGGVGAEAAASGSAPRSRSPGRDLVDQPRARTARRGSRGRRPAAARRPARRSSSRGGAPAPSMIRRRVSDWPASKAYASRRSSGTSKVTATASSVSRSTAATVRVWKRAARGRAPLGRRAVVESSDLLHVLERLEAVGAAVERLARGRPELRGQLDVRPSRSAGRSARGGSAAASSAIGPSRPGPARARRCRARRSARRPRSVIQSLDQAGRQLDPDRDVGEAGVGRAGAPGRRAWWPSPGSRSTSA